MNNAYILSYLGYYGQSRKNRKPTFFGPQFSKSIYPPVLNSVRNKFQSIEQSNQIDPRPLLVEDRSEKLKVVKGNRKINYAFKSRWFKSNEQEILLQIISTGDLLEFNRQGLTLILDGLVNKFFTGG